LSGKDRMASLHDMPTSTNGFATTAEASVGPMPAGRLLFRFTIGLMQLSAQRFGSVLRAASATHPPGDGDGGREARASRLRDIAVGSLVAIPGAITELRSLLRARTLRLRRLARRCTRLRADLPSIPRGLGRVELWEARAVDQLDRLADAGQREQAAARTLATGVIKRLIQGGTAEFAESADVKRVIHQQSQGIAGAALTEIRDRTERADDAAENVVRRILRIPREEPA
jgi:hypothetical protein